MKRKLSDLTKNELLSILYNDYDLHNGIICECAACGEDDKAQIYFVCDNCQENMRD